MNTFESEIAKTFNPKRGEVWKISDKEILLNQDKNQRRFKSRPAIVLSPDFMHDTGIVIIIPMHTVKKDFTDASTLPLNEKCFTCTDKSFRLDDRSHALTTLTQPIRKQHLDGKCGQFEEAMICYLQHYIATEIIGFDGNFNFSF